LNLKRPIYSRTAANGHFGHAQFPWEQPKQLEIAPALAAKLVNFKKEQQSVTAHLANGIGNNNHYH
jgi:hypothetical protein